MNQIFLFLLAGISTGSICNDLLDSSGILSSDGGCTGEIDIGQIRPLESNSTLTICLGLNATTPVSIVTKSDFILRRIELPGLTGSSIRMADGASHWYTSPSERDINAQWSTLPVVGDGTVSLAPDIFQFSNLTLWVNGTAKEPVPIRIYGCRADETQTVDYVFNSTAKAVERVFTAVEFLETLITSILTKHGKFSSNRVSVRMARSDTPNTVVIRLTVFPSDSRPVTSVTSIVDYLSKNEKLLSSLSDVQALILDDTTHLCFDKICPSDSLCVDGQCRVRHTNEAVSPGLRPTVPAMHAYATQISATEAKATTSSWFSEYGAYIIPLIIGGVTLVIIIGLVLFRWYKRGRF